LLLKTPYFDSILQPKELQIGSENGYNPFLCLLFTAYKNENPRLIPKPGVAGSSPARRTTKINGLAETRWKMGTQTYFQSRLKKA
jgi:hypothetical protein